MWSWSSWDRKIHRTSSGSTTENACSSQASRTSAAAGVDDHRLVAPDHEAVGAEDAARRRLGASVGISHVSAATGWAVVGNRLSSTVTSCSSGSSWLASSLIY